MKCAACRGGIPPGKVLFCPPCFVVLSNKDQREMVSHYVRVCRAEGRAVLADNPGIKDKVEKLARKIREIRKLDAPKRPLLFCYDSLSGGVDQVVRLNPSDL